MALNHKTVGQQHIYVVNIQRSQSSTSSYQSRGCLFCATPFIAVTGSREFTNTVGPHGTNGDRILRILLACCPLAARFAPMSVIDEFPHGTHDSRQALYGGGSNVSGVKAQSKGLDSVGVAESQEGGLGPKEGKGGTQWGSKGRRNSASHGAFNQGGGPVCGHLL